MSTLHLTIWKPFRSERTVRYAWNAEADDSSFDASKLQEMIYSWTPDEDVLSGIADETIRAELRSLMFEDFYEGLLPEQRSFAKLGHLISRLEQLQSEPKAMEWTSTSQMVDPTHWKREARKPGEEASSTLRCAPTIALYQHLLWLTDVFGKMPGLSIIIG